MNTNVLHSLSSVWFSNSKCNKLNLFHFLFNISIIQSMPSQILLFVVAVVLCICHCLPRILGRSSWSVNWIMLYAPGRSCRAKTALLGIANLNKNDVLYCTYLFVGIDENWSSSSVLMSDDVPQFYSGFLKPFLIGKINDKNNGSSFTIIILPQGSRSTTTHLSTIFLLALFLSSRLNK